MKNGLRDWMQLITRIDEMIYKEANILFPNCAVNYSESEWYDIYRDSKVI